MKLKKAAAFGLSIVISVSVLSGCGSTAEESKATEKQENTAQESSTVKESEASETVQEDTGITFPLEETVSFTGMAIMNQSYKLSESLSWKTMKELTNVDIELIGEFQSAESTEKMNLLINSGDYPDMIYKPGGLDVFDLGQQGILIPLEDLIREYAPNLTAKLDEEDLWDEITYADGHIYGLPYMEGKMMYYGGAPLWINKRWMDNLGLEEPKNLEDLYQVLKAFKEQDANGNGDPNDEVPFTFATNIFTPNRFLAYMEEGLFYADIYSGIIDDELVFYPLTDGFKDNYLAYLKKMYEEGIIDKNAFTQQYDQMTVNGKAADIHGMFFRSGPNGQVAEGYFTDYITLKPWTEGHLPMIYGASSGMLITDKCEHPEILVAWADYFYTEEGFMLADMGVEGETYKYYDDGTYGWIVDGTYGETQTEVKNSQCMQGTAGAAMYLYDIRYNINPEDDPAAAWTYKERELNLYKMGTVMPVMSFTAEEQEQISDLQTQIFSYIETYTAQAVTGQVDLESSYAEFQDSIKKMGADKLQEIYQTAYGRAVAE